MEGWQIALILKPIGLLLFLCFLAGVRIALQLWMPDCWLKRLLLYRVEDPRGRQ